jgi:type II secretory pathway pseudopilin PulG
MKSVTCSSCGFVSWAAVGDCKQCGRPLPLDQTYQRPSPPPPHVYGAAPDYFGAPPKKRKGHAVASLVIGITGFCTFGLFLIGSVVGTILGIVALSRERREPATYGGRGMAIAGIVLNVAALVMIVPVGIIAAIAIPNLLASRIAANEASALNTIRVISEAEDTYMVTAGEGEFGELADLVKHRLVNAELLGGVRHGYRFTLVNNGSDFEVSATPVSEGAGRRSFFYSSDDEVIRARLGQLPATADDPPLNSYNDSRSRRAPHREDIFAPAD